MKLMEIYDLGYWNGFRCNHYEYGNLYIGDNRISCSKDKYKIDSHIRNRRFVSRLHRENYDTHRRGLNPSIVVFVATDKPILKKDTITAIRNTKYPTTYRCSILHIRVPLNHSIG